MSNILPNITDALRWWAAGGVPGALLFLSALAFAASKTDLHETRRAVRTLATMTIPAMFATILAGAIIPWAGDGRIDGFTRENHSYQSVLAFSWMLWGITPWTIACYFSARPRVMMLASCLWFAVCCLAAWGTEGASL